MGEGDRVGPAGGGPAGARPAAAGLPGDGPAGAPLFRGVGVALLTFFTDSGALAPEASAEHAARLVEAGIAAVLVSGTTGEPFTLEDDERLALLDAVRAAVPPGSAVPVLVGTGAPSARQADRLTRAACDHGADAVLALSPPRATDPRPYYDAVAKAAAGVPVLAYHFPLASAPGITVDELLDLPVAGCKDSSGDATRLIEELGRFRGSLWVGSPSLVLLAAAMGGAGAILALANALPERCLAALAGDVAAQAELAGAHLVTSGRFPAALKELTARRYGTPATARLG
ncbi:MAG: dihydrodipicolinate synthase family protein [Acidimicrobiales bacterium]